ncbi:hypothetical protein RclHR1_06480007 [Rhizophagus clarus]|uniref:DDE-1 domain-containing protein n=1 Tax=Rhizophagus clarus TaxID=94130 RepID=A0A2Z6SIM7_9GLOM|nr:hypothetical protein RclHR1_06480007 [Rhizophagus clarus]GES77433.1 hypothetical protein GLOIN_2v1477797 [Rhizophagus clarus]
MTWCDSTPLCIKTKILDIYVVNCIFDALQNVADVWSMVSFQTISYCWKKTGILPPNNEIEETFKDFDSIISNSFEEEINKLNMLILQLLKGDLNVYEYIYIENKIPEGRLTNGEIINTMLNADREDEVIIDEIEFMPVLEKVSPIVAEKAISETIRFLYKQELEFGKINEELNVLRKLYKKVKLLIVKNLKQLDLHHFHNNMFE